MENFAYFRLLASGLWGHGIPGSTAIRPLNYFEQNKNSKPLISFEERGHLKREMKGGSYPKIPSTYNISSTYLEIFNLITSFDFNLITSFDYFDISHISLFTTILLAIPLNISLEFYLNTLSLFETQD